MRDQTSHITVCICTYKRPQLLLRLLDLVAGQETDSLFTHSIVVVDNDHLRSAEPTVTVFEQRCRIPVLYCVEPRQGIALARNKAVDHANGDYVAFIDDDEFPSERWLVTLLRACRRYAVDGVLGPVKPHYDEAAPLWVKRGGFYNRPTHPTGTVIDWRKGRTGNTLLKRSIFEFGVLHFRPEFRTGEDQDFFRRMTAKGHQFVWCDEAVVYEVVPPVRWNRRFMIRRSLLRGANSLQEHDCRACAVARSAAAAGVYTVSLPVAAMLGQAAFMLCLVKLCDHAGLVLAALGIHVVEDAYVTE